MMFLFLQPDKSELLRQFPVTTTVYPIIQSVIIFVVMAVVLAMILRLILNYTDPNPFGKIGRLGFKLKKLTDRIVQPSAFFLARMGIDTKIAPLITILAFCVFGYFTLELSSSLFMTIDGVYANTAVSFNIVKVVGHLLYGFLSLYSLAIVMRIVFSWFMSLDNRLLKFLIKITEPILAPFRRMMPPVLMFDISPIIVLLIIWFLRMAVASVLLSN